MKTTIEIKGYQIVIDETEEMVTVTAMKDDETVEEFSLDLGEEAQGKEAQGEEGIRSFDDFGGEEEDFDGEEAQDEDEIQDEIQDDEDDEDDENEEEESENKLESFQSFINKKN
jgi:hypothetical protein